MIFFTFTIDTGTETDQEYLEHLYKKYNRLMFATAHHYFADSGVCEDVVQDAIVNLCSKAKLLRGLPNYAVSAYIVFTVKNVAINQHRHQAVVAKHTQELDDDNLEETNVNPQDYLLLAELRNDLAKAWALLPEQDQELLYRKYVFEQNNAELADIFHCREDNIRVRLTRARRRAAKLIKEAGIHENA